MSREIIRVEPLSSYLERYKAPASVMTRHGNTLYVSGLPPITMKGISREVIPYAIEGMLDATGQQMKIFSEHLTGLDFYLDPSMVHSGSAERIRVVLQDAIATLEEFRQRLISQTPITGSP